LKEAAMKRICRGWIGACAAAALFAGCGGGGDDMPAAMPGALDAVPAAANESPTGLVGYLNALSAVNDQAEGAEPLGLDGFTPPRPEDTEPEAVS
jgi:hypothetical protein